MLCMEAYCKATGLCIDAELCPEETRCTNWVQILQETQYHALKAETERELFEAEGVFQVPLCSSSAETLSLPAGERWLFNWSFNSSCCLLVVKFLGGLLRKKWSHMCNIVHSLAFVPSCYGSHETLENTCFILQIKKNGSSIKSHILETDLGYLIQIVDIYIYISSLTMKSFQTYWRDLFSSLPLLRAVLMCTQVLEEGATILIFSKVWKTALMNISRKSLWWLLKPWKFQVCLYRWKWSFKTSKMVRGVCSSRQFSLPAFQLQRAYAGLNGSQLTWSNRRSTFPIGHTFKIKLQTSTVLSSKYRVLGFHPSKGGSWEQSIICFYVRCSVINAFKKVFSGYSDTEST